MYGQNPEVIDITVKGIAETEFTSASFRAQVFAQAKTGPEAKDKAYPIIEKLKQTIVDHAKTADIDLDRLITAFEVSVDTHRQTGEFVGYRATYTINFVGKNVREAPAVHDALTSIEYVQSPTPVYNLDDSSVVHSKAFSDAVTKAGVMMFNQCKALGLPYDKFYVSTWAIHEEQPSGKSLSFCEGAKAKPIGLEPGKGSLNMRVTFSYARKP